ncbi:MAG: T9SS type A sorting domain-containing protein [Bacteroidota bacterium]
MKTKAIKKLILFITVFISFIFFLTRINKDTIIEKKNSSVNIEKPQKSIGKENDNQIGGSNILAKQNTTIAKLSFRKTLSEREQYASFLYNHPFNQKTILADKEQEEEDFEENEKDHPELAWQQDFLRTMDPNLKRPTPEVLPEIVKANQAKMNSNIRALSIPGTSVAPWVERGPNNVGGRTRTLVWDPNDITGKKVWAGGVTGGLWYNNDITSASSSWTKVNDFWADLAISCLAFDPNDSKIAYAGTGEGFRAGASIGGGIWKTIDSGKTWNQIPSTTNFSYVNDIVVRNESGVSKIYAAIDAQEYLKKDWHNPDNAGLQTSSDGGTIWAQVLPSIPGSTSNFVAASICLGKDNRIWIGTTSSPYSGTDRGGGRVFYSDNGTTWNLSDSVPVTSGYGRVTVACAPSTAFSIYSFIENDGKVKAIRRSTNKGNTWTDRKLPVDADTDLPSTDFTRGQAWFDQALKVDPADSNVVIIGAIDLFRTTDGGNSWSQISKWSNNNYMRALTSSIVHADHHAIAFKPGSSSTVIFGTDGGVFYTTSISTASTNDVIAARNTNYNVTQFYAAAINPNIGSNNYLAGAQDNGTQEFNTAGFGATVEASGGDGGYCFIDQHDPNYQIVSYTNNNFYLSVDALISKSVLTILSDVYSGSFINPACYDNNLHILYTYKTQKSLYRVSNITSTPKADSVIFTGLTDGSTITAFKVSPYTTLSTTLFIGSSSGDLLKLANANTTPVVSSIGLALPVGSISCIEIGRNEDELLVTFFNYGLKKIWYSSDGGKNWIDKSGNFPNIPARWALFNPNNRTDEVILATELGIYGSTNFSSATPIWAQSITGFANVRTDMLQMRNSDYQVIAATHGRGLFSSNGFVAAGVQAPTITSFTPTSASLGQTVTITGTNLSGTTGVSFGGTAASSYTVVSATSVTAVVGTGTSGTVNVITPGGTAIKTGFTYLDLIPTITSFSPAGAAKGGSVTITGTNFTGATKVNFGDSTAASFVINSSTSITAVVGGGMSGNITVITPNGTATKANFDFLYLPVITLQPIDARICIGNSIQLYSMAFSNPLSTSLWQVNKGSGFVNLSETAPYTGTTTDTLVITNATTSLNSYQYRCVVTNSVGSTNSNAATILIDSLPTAATITNNRALTFCIGDSTVLTSSASSNNQWSLNGTAIAGATAATYTVKANGNYTVKYTNSNGCSATSTAKTIVVNALPTAPTITSKNATAFCQGLTDTLVSNGGAGNQWLLNGTAIANATGTSYVATTTGNYAVTVTNSNGCTSAASTATVITVNAIPTKPSINRDVNNNLVSSTAGGNQWYANSSAIVGGINQSYKPLLDGNYTVQVTQNGCVSPISEPYYYLVTALINILTNETVTVYPNPVGDELRIDYKLLNVNNLILELYDFKGVKLLEKTINNGAKISLSNYAKSSYILKLLDTKTHKVIYSCQVLKPR